MTLELVSAERFSLDKTSEGSVILVNGSLANIIPRHAMETSVMSLPMLDLVNLQIRCDTSEDHPCMMASQILGQKLDICTQLGEDELQYFG